MQNVHMIYCHFEFKRICKKPKVINRMIIVDFDLPPCHSPPSLSLCVFLKKAGTTASEQGRGVRGTQLTSFARGEVKG